MHSKAHFKSLFNSPKISTVQVKNIFFLNTTLPNEHYKIYFTNLGATKLKIQKSQITLESGIFELALNTAVADRWDLHVSWTHMSSRRNRAAALLGTARLRLIDGELRRR